MRSRIAALLAVASLASQPACAHRQLSNEQVAFGVVVAAGVTGLVFLAVTQCRKGQTYCESAPPARLGR